MARNMGHLETALFYFDWQNNPEILTYQTEILPNNEGYSLANDITVKIENVTKPISFRLYDDVLDIILQENYDLGDGIYGILKEIHKHSLNELQKYLGIESDELQEEYTHTWFN